ncbi:hypothetical protein QT13_05330 [Pectobacterium brasiliense]|uniref:hypothetical protein n=1 Tax=Pectobacterium brasiliense TaxID=180957 RepID=UPI000583E465|nr:hypothetical protein [Pectobacterium brasiliense]KHS74014.1 hypothetical protein QT13_05330 [Pectobacterium brasiliense]KHS87825.1 hypothetical protein RC83_10820 [Pectobacterium brasiliense]
MATYAVIREGIDYGTIYDNVFVSRRRGEQMIMNHDKQFVSIIRSALDSSEKTNTFSVDFEKKTMTRDDGTIFSLKEIEEL